MQLASFYCFYFYIHFYSFYCFQNKTTLQRKELYFSNFNNFEKYLEKIPRKSGKGTSSLDEERLRMRRSFQFYYIIQFFNFILKNCDIKSVHLFLVGRGSF